MFHGFFLSHSVTLRGGDGQIAVLLRGGDLLFHPRLHIGDGDGFRASCLGHGVFATCSCRGDRAFARFLCVRNRVRAFNFSRRDRGLAFFSCRRFCRGTSRVCRGNRRVAGVPRGLHGGVALFLRRRNRGFALRLRRKHVLPRRFPHSQELVLRGFASGEQLSARGFARREKRAFSRRDFGTRAAHSLGGFGARGVFRRLGARRRLRVRILRLAREFVSARFESRLFLCCGLLRLRELGLDLAHAFLQLFILGGQFCDVGLHRGKRRLGFPGFRFSARAFLCFLQNVRFSLCKILMDTLKLRLQRQVLRLVRGVPEFQLQAFDHSLELRHPRDVFVELRVFVRESLVRAFVRCRERLLHSRDSRIRRFLRRFLLLFVCFSLGGNRRTELFNFRILRGGGGA